MYEYPRHPRVRLSPTQRINGSTSYSANMVPNQCSLMNPVFLLEIGEREMVV
jgi:hypothetical protein